MAVEGYVKALLGGVDATLKRVLQEAFRYVVENGRFGPPEHQTKSESFLAYYVESTTPSTANTEFSIQHGMGKTPYLAIPLIPLGSSGYELRNFVVTRPADNQRVYFRTGATNTKVFFLLE